MESSAKNPRGLYAGLFMLGAALVVLTPYQRSLSAPVERTQSRDNRFIWRYETEIWLETGEIKEGWLKWVGRALDGTVVEEYTLKLSDIDPEKIGLSGAVVPARIQVDTVNHKRAVKLKRKTYVRTSKRLFSDVAGENDFALLTFKSLEEANAFAATLRAEVKRASASK